MTRPRRDVSFGRLGRFGVVVALALAAVAPLASPAFADELIFKDRWGTRGSGNGEFLDPADVAVGPSGEIHVADRGNSRVQVFDPRGNFLRKWGSEGSGDGQLDAPAGIDTDRSGPSTGTPITSTSGNVYVVEAGNNRVSAFDRQGNFLRKWGSEGTGPGQLKSPQGIAVEPFFGRAQPPGRVFVADTGNNRIEQFDLRTGSLVLPIITSAFNQPSGFIEPSGVDTSGPFLLVADTTNNRIMAFDGVPLFFLRSWGGRGVGDGQFDAPSDVVVGNSGHVFVADTDNGRVQQFDLTGRFIRTWGSRGQGPGRFSPGPKGLGVAPSGDIYVVSDHVVQRFRLIRGPDTSVTGAKLIADETQAVPRLRHGRERARPSRAATKVSVKVRVRSLERVRVSSRARFRAGRTYRSRRVVKQIEPGGRVTVKLEPKRNKDLKGIVRRLQGRGKVKAKVKAKFADEAGNKKTKRVEVRLRR